MAGKDTGEKLSGHTSLIVDTETGEIVHEHELEENERVRYTKPETENRKLVEIGNGYFVKLFPVVVEKLVAELTPAELRFVLLLTNHACLKDCVIRQTSNKKSRVVNQTELAELMGISKASVNNLMASLQEKQVVGKHRTSDVVKETDTKTPKYCYSVNPFIFIRGNGVERIIYQYYKNSQWNLSENRMTEREMEAKLKHSIERAAKKQQELQAEEM